MNFRSSGVALLACVAVSCGNESTPEVEALRAQAAAKEREVRALAVDTPCNHNNQCAGLTLGATEPSCAPPTWLPYSLVSATALQAQQAAAEHRAIAENILTLLPPPNFACPAVVHPVPTFSCTANRCIQDP